MYSANIKTIPHMMQRYETIGDWFMEGGCLQVIVSSMGNADYEFLVAIHELIEKQLCRKMGITEQMVDAWDLNHEDVEEPGEMEECPYREAHLIAEGMERALAVKLGVDWDHYDKTVRAVMEKHLPPKDPTYRDIEGGFEGGYVPHRNQGRTTKPRGKVRERSVLKGK